MLLLEQWILPFWLAFPPMFLQDLCIMHYLNDAYFASNHFNFWGFFPDIFLYLSNNNTFKKLTYDSLQFCFWHLARFFLHFSLISHKDSLYWGVALKPFTDVLPSYLKYCDLTYWKFTKLQNPHLSCYKLIKNTIISVY